MGRPSYGKPNRVASQVARRKTRWWCMGCDRQLVTHWKKCPVCGARTPSTKVKGATGYPVIVR